jgi:hypothetical protein
MKLPERLSQDYRKARRKAIDWGFRPALIAVVAAVVGTDRDSVMGIFTPNPTWIFSWIATLEFAVIAAVIVALMVGALALLYYQLENRTYIGN